MLKKWLKKRRKGTSRHAEAGAMITTTEQQNASKSMAKSLTRLSPGRGKKNKPKSPGRKSRYTSIEKDPSRHSHSLSSIPTNNDDKPVLSIRGFSDRGLPINSPTKFSSAKVEKKLHGNKKELPLVRIRPIERPKQRSASVRSALLDQMADSRPLRNSSPSLLPSPASVPPAPPAPTSGQPFAFSPSDLPEQMERDPSPPPTDLTDQLARELSYLGVASPPSIDTALFAYEDPEKGDAQTNSDETIISSPPALIETIMRGEKAPIDVESESEASVKRKFDILHEMGTSRPFQDDQFFTATRAQSGTGSRKLKIWLDEVKQSIDAQNGHTMKGFDRYHVGGEKAKEDLSEKDESETSHEDDTLIENKIMIDQVLKETIEKSKVTMTTSPRGILKRKTAEPESIKDVMPIKVFSKSRRQKLLEDTEDETTTSDESQTSSSGDLAYETLRQLNPSVSRDETLDSTNSMGYIYNKICDVGNLIGIDEDLLCQVDDARSVSDDTFESMSTASRDGSLGGRRGRWMCFDAF